ncbi:MAG: hypothetical protein NVS2B7_05810 [Herpetosiphon sp.]
MIARLKQLRAAQEHPNPPTLGRTNVSRRAGEPIVARFEPGMHVHCLPYGSGIVQASTLRNEHESLVIVFPDHGPITVDPQISLVRRTDVPDTRELGEHDDQDQASPW